MDQKWGSGDPKQYLTDLYLAAYDDHQYVKYAGVAENKDAYLKFSCGDNRSGNWPVFVGEWSLSVATDVQWTDAWNPNKDENKDFYRKWWAAQVMSYEKTAQGWVGVLGISYLVRTLTLFTGLLDVENVGEPQRSSLGLQDGRCG